MDLAAELAAHGPDAPSRLVSLAEAREYCRRLAAAHYENFTVVSWLFPRRLHQHLANVYAYCRWADDLADETASLGTPQRAFPTAREESLRLLEWWEAQLEAMYAGQTQHPVFVALAETVREFDLRKGPLADLLVAFRRDQVQTRYETMSDLLTYCEKSANPVGRIVLCLGRALESDNVARSDLVCTGLQLANFWQDVRRDWEQGRIYLPQDACRARGWDDARFAAGRADDDFRELLAPLVQHAELQLFLGASLVQRVPAELKLPVKAFVAGGQAVLAAIRRQRYDVWSRRPAVGRLTKLWLLAKARWSG
jgi:squalene synthase HpnC